MAFADSGQDGCDRAHCPEDAVFQAVPLQGLLAGILESPMTFASVLEQGDFGLGGMSPLDGEVIVLDGKPFHARLDGSLRLVDLSERTAVLWVKRFRADRQLTLTAVPSFDALVNRLDAGIGFRNRIHAIRIEGKFDRLKVRSVPRQSPPYVAVTEVVKSQQVLDLRDVEGTLVGFRFPPWAAGINAPGYHFHFVDADRRIGGHVLEVSTTSQLRAAVDTARSLTVVTPDAPVFDDADLTLPTGQDVYRRTLRTGQMPAPVR